MGPLGSQASVTPYVFKAVLCSSITLTAFSRRATTLFHDVVMSRALWQGSCSGRCISSCRANLPAVAGVYRSANSRSSSSSSAGEPEF